MTTHRDRVSCRDTEDVYIHFRIAILSGASTFTIKVPHRYLEDARRRFFFSQMHLVPNFYSLDAEKLALDADPAIDLPVTRSFQAKMFYRDNKIIYGNEYVNSTTLTKTVDLLDAINQHFENQKPDFAHATPLFFDWVDIALMTKPTDDIGDIVSKASDMYYGGAFDPDQYSNVLPPSARLIQGVNNFTMPWSSTTGRDIFNKRIRLRLWLAPNTKAVFSNTQIFVEDLGFTQSQLGRSIANQFHLANNKSLWLPVAVAKEAPKEQFTKREFKLRAWMTGPYLHTKIKTITMTQREWLDDTKLTQAVSQAVHEFSLSLNTVFSFSFDKVGKRYSVTFPNTDLVTLHLTCDPEFSHRIGMGYENLLIKGMKAEQQKDRMDHTQDAAKRAASVVFDTGPIACVLDEMSSNTTSQSIDQIMTSLYPTASGTLSMPAAVCQCSLTSVASRSVSLSANRYSASALSPVTFRLLRIYDDQKLTNFHWICDGYIYGVLQGTCVGGHSKV